MHRCWWAKWGTVTGVTLGTGTGDEGVGVVGAEEWLTDRMGGQEGPRGQGGYRYSTGSGKQCNYMQVHEMQPRHLDEVK